MRFIEHILSVLPTRLPIGREAFNRWAESVIRLSGVPDSTSTRFALGVMIMHRPATESSKPKRFFAKQLYKAAASEVAHAVISEIKEAQHKEAAQKATPPEAETKKMAEATAPAQRVADEKVAAGEVAGRVVHEAS